MSKEASQRNLLCDMGSGLSSFGVAAVVNEVAG